MKLNKIAVFTIVALALAGIGLSQSPDVTSPPSGFVYVSVNVTGPRNVPVTGLNKENFVLKEDGIEQSITSFVASNEPIDIDLILAMRALERGRADLVSSKIRESVENFRHQSNPRNKWVVEEMPFGANGIFDAMSRHITRLQQSSNPRKLVVVFTDGFESSGGDPGRQLQEYAKQLGVPIYIIYTAFNNPLDFGESRGLLPGLPGDIQDVIRGQRIYLDGGNVYEDLTRYTGGRLYRAEADTALPQFVEVLAAELKYQYVLGFKSTNDAQDGKWRKLEVKIKAQDGIGGIKQKDMKIKARDRYFVAKPN